MTDSVLAQAFIYLVAGVVCVPVAKRLGLGSVLGYLIAGVAIGPFALGLVGHEGEHVMHFAEFGVVMMLFLVGLELKPSVLWELRRPILGLGGAQVVATAGVVAGLGMAFGLGWKPALAVGTILAMSSTAIALQSLGEKGLLRTAGGQASFSVLLMQDIAVIPILAVFPLLGAGDAAAAHGADAGRPGWLQGLFVLGAVAGIVVAGRTVVRPAFRLLAQTRLREIFTAAALLLVVGIALLMTLVGLSPALGTFLAGVVLAESEYRHELESDIEPFKGLLLGLFFISVGAQIDFGTVARSPGLIGGLVIGVMAAKLAVLWGLGRVFGLLPAARWTLALALAQVGEFAFVLLSFGVQGGVFGERIAGPLVAVVALSMAATPLLFVLLERVALPRLAASAPKRPEDTIEHADSPVVIAGFGRFGQIVGRMLRANGLRPTVLDLDPEMVDVLGRLGVKVHYGDAARPELLHAAGCERAKLFVLAIDDPEQAHEVAATVRKHYPNLPILARARSRTEWHQLRRLGIRDVWRETYGSAFEMGIAAMRALGLRAHTAHRLAWIWRRHEEGAIEKLDALWGGEQGAYFAAARRTLQESEQVMRGEDPVVFDARDAAWDNESLRAEVLARMAGAVTPAAARELPPTPGTPDEGERGGSP